MSWWRSDDWQDVIADSTDPAVARLALTAAAGRSVGFDALAQAAESPAVVYAYNRAGADEAYAADVVAALDVYDRTTTALMAAGMPESIASSRAALVFGIPDVDGQYLAVARQTVMPSDILVATADEALARAFAHLVPDKVTKADDMWDEAEVNRDEAGRFAPEGVAARQAFRVVGGRKVAISTKTQVDRQDQVEQKKATNTDKQMLDALAERNKDERKYAEQKRAKRLQRLNRLRGMQVQQRESKARQEAKAKTESKRKGRAALTATQDKERSRKVLERRELRRGMSAEQLNQLRDQQMKERKAKKSVSLQQQMMEERQRLQMKYGPTHDPYDASIWDPWEEAGYFPEDLQTADAGQVLASPSGDQITAPDDELHLLSDRRGQVVDGVVVITTLTQIRNNAVKDGQAAGDDREYALSRAYDMVGTVTENLLAPTQSTKAIGQSMVWVAPYTYAYLGDVVDHFLAASDDTSATMYTNPDFAVFVFNPDQRSWEWDTRTVKIPAAGLLDTAKHRIAPSISIAKADGTWDEDEVLRDDLGRFAPEGARERVVGGRKVLVKVSSEHQIKQDTAKPIARSSTDAQDLKWVSDQNRQAALRRRRTARLRALQAQQKARPAVAEQKQVSAQKRAEKKTAGRKLLARQELRRGLSDMQLQELRTLSETTRTSAKQQSGGDTPGASRPEPFLNIVQASSPVGRALAKHADALSTSAGSEWGYTLQIEADDVNAGLVRQNTKGRTRVLAPGGWSDGRVSHERDGVRVWLFIDDDSVDELESAFLGDDRRLAFIVQGDGTYGNPFSLQRTGVDSESQETMQGTRVDVQGHRSSPY